MNITFKPIRCICFLLWSVNYIDEGAHQNKATWWLPTFFCTING